MDLLEGEPLDRFIAREGRCSVENTVQLLRPIAEALDAAHAAGVVHRDLKPQNIYLIWDATGETVPKLLDFGMAKLLGDSRVHTVSGTPLGTPLYMSPEQARGDVVDGRSDVYALGVLCHELLTGRLPITGENTIAVLMAHIIQAPPSVSEVCADLSPELDAPILRMLEKKPEQRPATASEALTELARAARARRGAGAFRPATLVASVARFGIESLAFGPDRGHDDPALFVWGQRAERAGSGTRGSGAQREPFAQRALALAVVGAARGDCCCRHPVA